MDKDLEDGRSSCKICGQVEGHLSQECSGAPVFKITKAGQHRRRDGELAYMVDATGETEGAVKIWRDANTGTIYYSDGFYTAYYEIPNALDIVERVDEFTHPEPPKIQIGAFSPITEYERRVIAAQILAGFCADPKATCVDDYEVERAVELADKLIARVRATHK